jgi:hypothetical protein
MDWPRLKGRKGLALRVILLVVIFGSVLPIFWLTKVQTERRFVKPSLSEDGAESEEEPSYLFKLSGVGTVKFEDNDKVLSLAADKIVYRNRGSEFFTYQNLRELYISDLKIDLFPRKQEIPENDSGRGAEPKLQGSPAALSLSFQDLVDRLPSFIGLPTTEEREQARERLTHSDVEDNIFTKVIIEKLFMSIGLQDVGKVLLSSDTAEIEPGQVSFEGDFSLRSSDGKTLTASTAIWTKEPEGLYFPEGFSLSANGKRETGKEAFFIIDREGKLIKNTKQVRVASSPLRKLDEAEARINVYLMKALFRNMPAFRKAQKSP